MANADAMSVAMRLSALVLLLAAVALACFFGYAHRDRLASAWRHHVLGQPDAKVVVGQPFPTITLQTPSGEDLAFAPAKGRVTIVNVFATWCPPCRAESADYARFGNGAVARGVDVVAVDQQESAAQVDDFRRKFGIAYPYFIDGGGITKDALNARVIPVTIVVDRDGVVRADIAGPVTYERLKSLAAQASRPAGG
jgi:thiol-disulfide isomerase/thioredoxin